jgi:hypothetical protein
MLARDERRFVLTAGDAATGTGMIVPTGRLALSMKRLQAASVIEVVVVSAVLLAFIPARADDMSSSRTFKHVIRQACYLIVPALGSASVKTRFSLAVATSAFASGRDVVLYSGGNRPRADIARPFRCTCNSCSITRKMPAEP